MFTARDAVLDPDGQRINRGSTRITRTLARMAYNDAKDVLIRREQTDSALPTRAFPGRAEELWRVMSPVAAKNPLHPWEMALDNARAHAKRTGGDIYRQVGNATPELIVRTQWSP